MKKNLFERFINGVPDDTNEKQNTQKREKTFKDGIAKQNDLLEKILFILQSNYSGQQISFNNEVLTIWIQDGLFYDSIIKSDFKEQLITRLNVELGFTFGAIKINSGNMPEQAKLITEVCPNVHLQISTIDIVQVIKTAKIYPVDGNGSTLDAYYILDSQEIRKMPNARYNIGIGKHTVTSDNSPRENYIAIDDDPHSPQFSKNRYVSRSHAYITFSKEYGFLLHVEHGGTRAAKKRTHIYRGSDKIELNNILIPEPLKNEDYIVLSKYVYLLFREF